MGEPRGVIARRWIRLLGRYSYCTGLKGCDAWTTEPRWAKVFPDEAAARMWLAGTSAEVVPASELDAVPSFTVASS